MYNNILLAVDIQDATSTQKALKVAINETRHSGGQLHILTVVPEFGYPVVGQYFTKDEEKKIIEEAKANLHAITKEQIPDDISVRHIVAQGRVYRRILRTAEKINADLIIVTAHRPELRDYLLGPNAARVVRHAECSVLVIRT